jgi:hypothetical protein
MPGSINCDLVRDIITLTTKDHYSVPLFIRATFSILPSSMRTLPCIESEGRNNIYMSIFYLTLHLTNLYREYHLNSGSHILDREQ